MARSAASSTVLVDNNKCILTLWEFAPGQETGWHKHSMDYVVMPKLSGQLMLENEDGSTTTVEVSPDKPYFRNAGVKHNVVSTNDFVFSFLEMEFK